MNKLLAVVALILLMLAPAYAWQDEDEDDDSYYGSSSSDSYYETTSDDQDTFLQPGVRMEGLDYYQADDGAILDPQTMKEYQEGDTIPSGKYFYRSDQDDDYIYVD